VYYLLVVPGLYATIPESEALTIGVFVGGIIYYYIVKVIRRSQGINIELAFHEIPPD
jgi:hypothetical protein